MYAVGRFLGLELLRHGGKVFAPATIDKVHGWFARYGVGVVLANRFLSGARSVISICAGIARLNTWLVAGCCLFMPCLELAAHLGGQQGRGELGHQNYRDAEKI